MGQPAHPAGPRPHHHQPAAHEDEWEYEYDDHETEHVFFTLDLTLHVPDALAANPDQDNVAADDPALSSAASYPTASPQLQIVDLHSPTPLVKFDDRLYNCHWSTDLGTQFHVSEPGQTANPYRRGKVLDVVATSQTRLIARPAKLHLRHVIPSSGRSRQSEPSETAGITIEEDSDGGSDGGDGARNSASAAHIHVVPGQPLKISREICKDQNSGAQASFLERLSQIKLQKGEKDQVPVYSVRIYDAPADADEIRKKAIEADAGKTKKRRTEDDTQQRVKRTRRRVNDFVRGPDGEPDSHKNAGRHGREKLLTRVGFDDGTVPMVADAGPSNRSPNTGCPSTQPQSGQYMASVQHALHRYSAPAPPIPGPYIDDNRQSEANDDHDTTVDPRLTTAVALDPRLTVAPGNNKPNSVAFGQAGQNPNGGTL